MAKVGTAESGASERMSVGIFGSFRAAFLAFASRSPSRFAILVFAALIGIFTLLFALPVSSAAGTWTNGVDAFFNAVSMVCVSGLTTVDFATYWSPLGNAFVFLATQIGALGVLTLASILGSMIAGHLGLRSRLMAASDTNPLRLHRGPVSEGQAIQLGEVGGLLITVAVSALTIEAVISMLILPSVLAAGYALPDALWYSVYYGAMSFTNTGVTPNIGGLEVFAHDYWFLSMLMIAVTLGSVGFPVIYAISRNLRRRKRWPLHVKLTLVTWAILWLLGGLAFAVVQPFDAAQFPSDQVGNNIFQAGFMSTMARSGGFALIDWGQASAIMLFIADVLMFIGGGSASTAGGIKVTTLAVLILAAWSEARGRSSLVAFGRRIPSDVLRLAVSVLLWGGLTVGFATFGMLLVTSAPFEHILFEVTSAFGTVGYSTGLSASSPDAGKIILALVMFMGRVGTVTLAAALAATQREQLFTRPEERPIVG